MLPTSPSVAVDPTNAPLCALFWYFQVYEHNSRDAIIASGVRSFPTFHFYLGGAKIDECRGANIAQVEQKVNQHKAAARCVSLATACSTSLFFGGRPQRQGPGLLAWVI